MANKAMRKSCLNFCLLLIKAQVLIELENEVKIIDESLFTLVVSLPYMPIVLTGLQNQSDNRLMFVTFVASLPYVPQFITGLQNEVKIISESLIIFVTSLPYVLQFIIGLQNEVKIIGAPFFLHLLPHYHICPSFQQNKIKILGKYFLTSLQLVPKSVPKII